MKSIKVLIPFIVVACMFLASCGLFKEYLSKDEIFKVAKDNHELLEKATEEIKNLNTASFFISTTEKRPIETELFACDNHTPVKEIKKIKGLYIETISDESQSYSNLNIENLSKVLDIKGLMSIDGWDTTRIIDFDCGGEGFGSAMIDYGFYFSLDNTPVGWAGEKMDLKQEGEWGYTEDDSDNVYYTERILDDWFYYEMGW